MDEKPTLELSVRACRDCRFSVPSFNEDNVEDEDLAHCTSPSAAMVGKASTTWRRAEAPALLRDANLSCVGPRPSCSRSSPKRLREGHGAGVDHQLGDGVLGDIGGACRCPDALAFDEAPDDQLAGRGYRACSC